MQIPETPANTASENDPWETRALQALAHRNRTWRTLAILALLWASVWVAFDAWGTRQREPLPADFVVDLNLASKSELSLVPGIGPKSADAILAYREAHGGFTRVEELTRIPGIKEGKLRTLRSYVTVGPRHATR